MTAPDATPSAVDDCDCLFASVYGALCIHSSRVRTTLRVACALDLTQRVCNEPGSAWTTAWEKSYMRMYDTVVRQGASWIITPSSCVPWVGRFFAADTLRTRTMFLQLARWHVLNRRVRAIEPEYIALRFFLDAHRIHLQVHTSFIVAPVTAGTHESPCIHVFRTNRGPFHPILDTQAALASVCHYSLLHAALRRSDEGHVDAVVAAGGAAVTVPTPTPGPLPTVVRSESSSLSDRTRDHERMVAAERRALGKTMAAVQGRIETLLLAKGYTRCEVHFRNRRVLQIRQVHPTEMVTPT